jgi:hypothetical protein
LAHRDCRHVRGLHDYDLSAELGWFADEAAALRKLADMAVTYAWSASELKRLVLVAWAVPVVASDEDRARSIRYDETCYY